MLKKKSQLEISTFGENNECLLVVMSGEIDHHNAVRVRTEIDERISEFSPKKTVLDLSCIDFMDSSGLGLIMGRYAKMKGMGGVLSVKNPSERTEKILRLAGIEKIVNIEREESKNEG